MVNPRKAYVEKGVVLVLIAALACGCPYRQFDYEDPEVACLEEFSIDSTYSFALERALAWQPDAYAYKAYAYYSDPSAYQHADRIYYCFATELRGKWQAYMYLDVYPDGSMHQGNGPAGNTDQPAPSSAIPLAGALISSSQALKAAEEAGGTAYRLGKENVGCVVYPFRTWSNPEKLQWFVRYQTESDRPHLECRVDGQTGDVECELYPGS